MIPFLFNENRFSFFVADHLLVDQLCTNPKCDRSLLSCLKMAQCSTSKIGDVLLYNLCCLLIQVMTTGPLPAPKMQIWIVTNNRDVPRVMKTKLLATVMVFGVVPSEGHIMPPHIFEVSLKVNTKVYLDMLKNMMISWCNQVAGDRRNRCRLTSPETWTWLLKECYDFASFSHWPPSSPDLNLLDYFIWSYIENITNMTSHNIKASLIATIRRHLWKRHAPSSRSVSRR